MNINGFISNFKGGLRPNRFKLYITYPAAALGAPNAADEFLVRSASLPKSELGTIKVPYMGREYKVAGDRVFSDWTVEFMCDESFSHRDTFMRWLDSVNGHESNILSGSPADPNFYQTTITITPMSRGNTELKRMYLRYAFPTEVGDIKLAYDDNDKIATFDVNFSYAYWDDINVTT